MYKHYKNGYYVSKTGKVKRIVKNKQKTVDLYTSRGYYYFILHNNNNEKIWLHRAIAEIFIPKKLVSI